MEIKLLKITHSFINKNLYYADFEIVDRKIRIKGMSYRSKIDKLFFPRVFTEGKAKYCPIMFTEPKEIEEFIQKGLEAIHAVPLPEVEESIENVEKIVLKRIAKKEKIARDKEERKAIKLKIETEQMEKKIASVPPISKTGVISRIAPKSGAIKFGKKTFTEVALRK